MKKLVCLLMFGLLLSCPSDDSNKSDYLTIKNNSEINIYIFKRGSSPILYDYPPPENRLIFSGEEVIHREEYRSFMSDGSKLFVWLFDEEVVNSTPWEEIVEKDMYLVRYDLTLQDLEVMNWIIDYTGE